MMTSVLSVFANHFRVVLSRYRLKIYLEWDLQSLYLLNSIVSEELLVVQQSLLNLSASTQNWFSISCLY